MAFSGGSGTVGDPYQVATAADLALVESYLASFFIQINNIDLSASGDWLGIADCTTPFTGTYDGGGFNITGMATRDTSSAKRGGLFAGVGEGAVIKNVNLVNPVADFQYVSYANSGLFVSDAYRASFDNCHVTGGVVAHDKSYGTGGFTGGDWECSYNNCSAESVMTVPGGQCADMGGFASYSAKSTFLLCSADVKIVNVTGGIGGGGFIGLLQAGYDIQRCWATGSAVMGDSPQDLGGFIGRIENYFGENAQVCLMANCYTQLNIEQTAGATTYDIVGGFAGYIDSAADYTYNFTNCYSAGLILGRPAATDAFVNIVKAGLNVTFTACFYDVERNISTSTQATAKTTVEMTTRDTFKNAAWDFTTVPIWYIYSSYPVLEGNVNPPVDVTPDPVDPKLLIRYRNDGKPNWSNYREVSLGKLGDTEIFKRISGLGSYRNRQYEIVCTAGVPLTITGLEENVNLGGTRGE